MPRPTREELIRRGRQARKTARRRSHATCPTPADRPDPLAILAEQDKARDPDLLGLRYARMSASPFTFLRGAAAVMAADLARTPTTPILTQLCGDAHLLNIETFATPERRLVFDITDFDETAQGPFEWDLKRLITSFVLAARNRGFAEATANAAVHRCLTRYRSSMREHSEADVLDVWYSSIDEHDVLSVLGTRVEDGALGDGLLDWLGFTEGWATYAEALSSDIGPDGSLPSAMALHLFRLSLLARVDVGVHALGWSPESAADTLKAMGGYSAQEAGATVDGILMTPGKQASYFVGYLTFRLLRDAANHDRFEAMAPRAFHHIILRHGPLPLGTARELILEEKFR